MISAEEKRKIQTQISETTCNQELEQIETKIEQATDSYIIYYGNVSMLTKDRLETLGYEVEFKTDPQDQRGYCEISWFDRTHESL